ncbi:MAG: glycosyltransferase family 39 protein [Planctomycetes bacterium]|nr:glycosyltransferase family 39 protein [Planctomycetota bacterium]
MPALLLFLFALALRLLFVAATPDGGACWHTGFQGDAPLWQDLAARFAHGVQDPETVLPWRPPGMPWLVSMLTNGEGASLQVVRWSFVGLGAAIPVVLWLLLRTVVTLRIALVASLLCAVSTNLMLLSSGLHVETPYLLGVLLTLFDQRRFAHGASAWVGARWGLAHGLLCLLRAEHVLVAAAFAALAVANGLRWRPALFAAVAFAVPLVPWQLHANAQVAAFNTGAPALPPTALPWDDDATAALRTLPSFQQVPVQQFVTDTIRTRGGARVRAADLGVVREAYGVNPVPLVPRFVALQGAMDFWLANTPEANGAFSREALDRAPPLVGGDARYPRGLRTVLPRGGALSLNYPVHLDAFVNGYSRGLAEIGADPAGAAARVLRKLWHGVQGATGGLGGFAVPIGLSGVRRPVDLVTATGPWADVWRAFVCVVAAVGWWRLRRERALWPLFAFAAVRFVVIAAFFGYARQGALCVPVVAVGVAAALAAAAGAVPARAAKWLLAAFLGALLAAEMVRATGAPVAVDGRPWLGPVPGEPQFAAHTLTFA